MIQTFWITGTLPGLNEMLSARGQVKGSWNRYAELKRQTEDHILWEAKRQRIRPVTNGVKLNFIWIEPNRRRDPDNVAAGKKLILDALVKGGLLSGDGWKQVKGLSDRFEISKAEPGVLVEIDG